MEDNHTYFVDVTELKVKPNTNPYTGSSQAPLQFSTDEKEVQNNVDISNFRELRDGAYGTGNLEFNINVGSNDDVRRINRIRYKIMRSWSYGGGAAQEVIAEEWQSISQMSTTVRYNNVPFRQRRYFVEITEVETTARTPEFTKNMGSRVNTDVLAKEINANSYRFENFRVDVPNSKITFDIYILDEWDVQNINSIQYFVGFNQSNNFVPSQKYGWMPTIQINRQRTEVVWDYAVAPTWYFFFGTQNINLANQSTGVPPFRGAVRAPESVYLPKGKVEILAIWFQSMPVANQHFPEVNIRITPMGGGGQAGLINEVKGQLQWAFNGFWHMDPSFAWTQNSSLMRNRWKAGNTGNNLTNQWADGFRVNLRGPGSSAWDLDDSWFTHLTTGRWNGTAWVDQKPWPTSEAEGTP